MKLTRDIVFAALLAAALQASAQEAPGEKERGPAAADAALHAMAVQYPTPYRAMDTAEIKAVLDRVFNYLDRVTPAEVVNQSTGAPSRT